MDYGQRATDLPRLLAFPASPPQRANSSIISFLPAVVRNQDFAREILLSLGLKPRAIYEILGQGEVNHVYVCHANGDSVVVRFARDPLDTDDYSKEAWAMDNVREAGVPSAIVVRVGNLDGVSYIVQEYISGKSGDSVRTDNLWITLGTYARLINQIPLDAAAPEALFPRFGRDLASNWNEHVHYNLEQLSEEDPLLGLGVYGKGEQSQLADRIRTLRERVSRFGLTHGDLVPKNVIIRTDGVPVVIDWGSASTGATPHYDYLRIWLDEANEGFTARDMELFAAGYGTPLKDLKQDLMDLVVLNSLDIVRWAIDKRKYKLAEYVKRSKKRIASIIESGC